MWKLVATAQGLIHIASPRAPRSSQGSIGLSPTSSGCHNGAHQLIIYEDHEIMSRQTPTSIYIIYIYICIILYTSIYYIAIPRGPSGHLGTLHSPALQHDRCRVVMGSAAMATEKVPRFLWSWRTTMDTWSGHVWTCFPKWMEKVPKCWSDMNFVWDTWIIHGHYLRAGQLGVVFSVNFLGL